MRPILILLTLILTVFFLFLLGIALDIRIRYPGVAIPNEAYGLYSLSLMGALVMAIPGSLCWYLLFRKDAE